MSIFSYVQHPSRLYDDSSNYGPDQTNKPSALKGGGGTGQNYSDQAYQRVGAYPDHTAVLALQNQNNAPQGGGVDPLTGLRSTVSNKIQMIQQAYDALTGNVRAQALDQLGQNNKNYDQQLSGLNDQYQATANGLGGAYAARGLGDSSFYGAAQQNAGKTYGDNQQAILDARDQSSAGLGRWLQTQTAQNEAGKNSYGDYLNNLGNYTADDLNSLNSNLGQAYGSIQGQAAGVGTNQQYLQALQQFAPTQNQGSSQLASQLQQLNSSGAPTFAKDQIQQGLIKQAGINDPNQQSYWSDYWKQLQGGQ